MIFIWIGFFFMVFLTEKALKDLWRNTEKGEEMKTIKAWAILRNDVESASDMDWMYFYFNKEMALKDFKTVDQEYFRIEEYEVNELKRKKQEEK